jgi:hypothetical protein
VDEQLPAFENEDWGLLLYGLASMGQPLAPAFLGHLTATAGRRLHGLSGEALGLLAWGLAQYGGPLPLVLDAAAGGGGAAASGGGGAGARAMPRSQAEAAARRRRERLNAWWGTFFAECDLKWESTGPRGGALMLVGLGTLEEAGQLPLPPGEWQSGMLGALRAAFGKPASWRGLLRVLRRAAGMGPDEPLPGRSLWFCGMLLDWGRRCGLEPPPQGMGRLVADEDAWVAAAAAEAEVEAAAAAAAAAASVRGPSTGHEDAQAQLRWQQGGAVLPAG